MSVAIAAVLIVGGFLAALALVAAVPVFIGLLAFDMSSSREPKPVTGNDSHLKIAIERGVARGFVIAGGAFWSIAAFAGLHSYQENGTIYSALTAFIPLVLCAAALIVGWYFERTVSALLAAVGFAVIPYGIIYQFEMGVWVLMVLALVGPMLTSATLFWAARREQEAFEAATATRPQLAFVFAARSSLS